MDIISALAGIPLPTLVALAAVVIIGLPHGALDGAIAIHLGMSRNLLSLTRFLVLYIAAAAAVVGAWMMAPVACLLVFLVISMLHFGMGDVRAGNGWQGMLEALAHGGLVVAGISQMHRDEVDVIFGYLVDGTTLLVWQGLEIISIFVAVALLFCVVQGVINRRWRGGLAELVIMGAIFAFTPPLVGFAIYFCLVHTPRHVRSILSSVSSGVSRRLMVSQAVLFTVASWVAGGLAFWLLLGAETAEAALMRVVFIGLAALTVPHMILVDGLFRRVQPSLRRQFMSQ